MWYLPKKKTIRISEKFNEKNKTICVKFFILKLECKIKSRKPWFIRLSGLVISNWDFPYRIERLYKCEKYIRCVDCGILVRKTKGTTKYCKNCKKENELERYKRYNEKRKLTTIKD